MKIEENDNILEELEEYKIRVRRLNNVKSKLIFRNKVEINTLADILYNMIASSQRIATAWVNKSGAVHKQKTGLRRSAEDMYLITKQYIPDITFTHIKHALNKLNIWSSYCPDVGRVVYFRSIFQKTSIEEFNDILNKANLNIKICLKEGYL